MKPRNCSGLTWVEVLVCLAIVGVLAFLALPSVTVCGPRGTMTQTLSNMKQLHLVTQQMALDGQTTGDKMIGWPGDIGGTFTNWERQVVPAYMRTNDFCKLLSAPGVIVPPGKMPTKEQAAVLVYSVQEKSGSNVVLLTTANFTNTPEGGVAPLETAKPYGRKGFVVFRKGGDGAILLTRQAGDTNLVGAYAPLCR